MQRGFSRIWFGAVLTALVQPSRVLASELIVLQPYSSWQVDYGSDFCTMARQFGTGDGAVFLLFKKFGPSNSFSLTFAGKPIASLSRDRAAQVRFGPGEDWQRFKYFFGSLGKATPAVFSTGRLTVDSPSEEKLAALENGKAFRTPPVAPERLTAIRHVSIRQAGGVEIQVNTGGLLKPFAEMEKCVRSLVESWGFDPVAMETLRSGPVAITSSMPWVSDMDYPKSMIIEGRRAIVHFLLTVDSQGAVTSCKIQQSAGHLEFDEAVCKLVTARAKFTPAIGADGQPTAAYWQNSVIFNLP